MKSPLNGFDRGETPNGVDSGTNRKPMASPPPPPPPSPLDDAFQDKVTNLKTSAKLILILVIMNKGKGGFHHYSKADPPSQHPPGAN